MKCEKCGGEIKAVKLMGGMPSIPVYLSYKKKGIFESEKQSLIDCHICIRCGAIELRARNPEVFRDI